MSLLYQQMDPKKKENVSEFLEVSIQRSVTDSEIKLPKSSSLTLQNNNIEYYAKNNQYAYFSKKRKMKQLAARCSS